MQLLSSVVKSLDVLESFTEERPELSLTEISQHLQTHKSSVFRILGTLEFKGFLIKDRESNKYRLGFKLLDLANRVLHRYNLRDHAGPLMEQLAEKTGEMIHLSILDGAEIVYLEKKGQGQVLTVATRVGGRHPAYASAMGKVLLAGLSSEEAAQRLGRRPLKKYTPQTINDPSTLFKVLEQVNIEGYSIDDEEAFPGIRCVAAPIRDRGGQVIAALSVSAPIQRMDESKVRKLQGMLVETAGQISELVRLYRIEE